MGSERMLMIASGITLWLSLMVSFLGGLSLARLPGVPASQVLTVFLLVVATLLLGVLIGKDSIMAAPGDRPAPR